MCGVFGNGNETGLDLYSYVRLREQTQRYPFPLATKKWGWIYSVFTWWDIKGVGLEQADRQQSCSSVSHISWSVLFCLIVTQSVIAEASEQIVTVIDKLQHRQAFYLLPLLLGLSRALFSISVRQKVLEHRYKCATFFFFFEVTTLWYPGTAHTLVVFGFGWENEADWIHSEENSTVHSRHVGLKCSSGATNQVIAVGPAQLCVVQWTRTVLSWNVFHHFIWKHQLPSLSFLQVWQNKAFTVSLRRKMLSLPV